MKKCPRCAEEIQDEAIYCRFCHLDLAKAKSTVENSLFSSLLNRFLFRILLVIILLMVSIGLGLFVSSPKLVIEPTKENSQNISHSSITKKIEPTFTLPGSVFIATSYLDVIAEEIISIDKSCILFSDVTSKYNRKTICVYGNILEPSRYPINEDEAMNITKFSDMFTINCIYRYYNIRPGDLIIAYGEITVIETINKSLPAVIIVIHNQNGIKKYIPR